MKLLTSWVEFINKASTLSTLGFARFQQCTIMLIHIAAANAFKPHLHEGGIGTQKSRANALAAQALYLVAHFPRPISAHRCLLRRKYICRSFLANGPCCSSNLRYCRWDICEWAECSKGICRHRFRMRRLDCYCERKVSSRTLSWYPSDMFRNCTPRAGCPYLPIPSRRVICPPSSCTPDMCSRVVGTSHPGQLHVYRPELQRSRSSASRCPFPSSTLSIRQLSRYRWFPPSKDRSNCKPLFPAHPGVAPLA